MVLGLPARTTSQGPSTDLHLRSGTSCLRDTSSYQAFLDVPAALISLGCAYRSEGSWVLAGLVDIGQGRAEGPECPAGCMMGCEGRKLPEGTMKVSGYLQASASSQHTQSCAEGIDAYNH